MRRTPSMVLTQLPHVIPITRSWQRAQLPFTGSKSIFVSSQLTLSIDAGGSKMLSVPPMFSPPKVAEVAFQNLFKRKRQHLHKCYLLRELDFEGKQWYPRFSIAECSLARLKPCKNSVDNVVRECEIRITSSSPVIISKMPSGRKDRRALKILSLQVLPFIP